MLTAFIILVLIASPLFYSIYWSGEEIPAINAIPNDAALILKVNDITQTWPVISKNQIWKNFTNDTLYSKLDTRINTFIKLALQNTGFSATVKLFPLYISLHPLHEGGAGLLFTLQTGHYIHDKDINPFIQKFFGSNIQIINHDFGGVTIRKIIFRKAGSVPYNGKVINLAFLHGILIASENSGLINEAILMLQSGESINKQPAFIQVSHTESSKAQAILYVNYHNLPLLLNNQLDKKSLLNIAGISRFSDWTELDVLIKEKNILLDGFTSVSDSSSTYLKLFSDQQTRPSSVDSLLPGNTAGFINVGFKDYKTIFRRLKLILKKQSKLDGFEKKLKAISDTFNINAEQTLTGWIKDEMGVAVTNNLSLSEEENVYAYFKTRNQAQAEASLSILAKANSMIFNGITIHVIEYPSLLPLVYGNIFPDSKKYYFAIAGDYVVFSCSINAMTAFLSSYTSRNTLSGTPSFQCFKNYTSGTSNVWIYSDLSQIVRHISNMMLPGDKQKYPLIRFVKSAKLLSTEFSLENKLFYTSICLENDTTNQTSNQILPAEQPTNQPVTEWTSYVGAIQRGPVVIKTDKGYLTFLLDENNKIWCINDKGKVVWSHITGGHILSDIRTIDFQSHKCIAFNSSELIYLLKFNGDFEPGFPLKIPFTATNGLTPNNAGKDGLSFFLANSKNSIQSISSKSQITENWTPVQMKARIIKPVEIIDHNGHKLMVITDEAGRIKITDLKGVLSGDFDKVPNISRNTQIWPNKITSKGDIICAAADGDLLYIKKDGTYEKLPFETVITNPFLLVDQFENNGKLNYLFFDQARFTVFNQRKEIVYEYDLSSFPRFRPLVFTAPDNKKYYLVTSGNSRLLLFNAQGITRLFPDISSENPPAVIPLEGTRSVLILTIEKQILNAYKYTF